VKALTKERKRNGRNVGLCDDYRRILDSAEQVLVALGFAHGDWLAQLRKEPIYRDLIDAGWPPKSLQGISLMFGPGMVAAQKQLWGRQVVAKAAHALDAARAALREVLPLSQPLIGLDPIRALDLLHSDELEELMISNAKMANHLTFVARHLGYTVAQDRKAAAAKSGTKAGRPAQDPENDFLRYVPRLTQHFTGALRHPEINTLFNFVFDTDLDFDSYLRRFKRLSAGQVVSS
jgi:hypothetical protein